MKKDGAGSLYQKIAADICEGIASGALRPGDRVRSEHELAEQYGVSVITTKTALNSLADKGVVERFRGKGTFIAQAPGLAALGYLETGENKKPLQGKMIGLVLPSMKTRVDQQLLDALEKEVAETGYLLAVRITRENQAIESDAVQTFIRSGASGLIIFPAENETYNEDLLRLSYDHFPFVFLDRYLKGIRANSVVCDNFEATNRLIGGLLGGGVADIGFVSPDTNNSVTADRIAGFKRAFTEKGVVAPPQNLCLLPTTLAGRAEKRQYVAAWLAENPGVKTLFCVNQEMSGLVYEALQAAGTTGAYKLYAFDDPGHPGFAYLRQDTAEIARRCVEILLRVMEEGGKGEVSNVVVPTALRER